LRHYEDIVVAAQHFMPNDGLDYIFKSRVSTVLLLHRSFVS